MNTRPIKFRVWEKLNNRFLDWKKYNHILFNIRNGTFNTYGGVLKIEDYIFQQFTGLTDCKGKEIYEGDIVSVLDENNIFEVKFGKVKRNIVGFDTNTIYPVELNTFYFEQEGRPYFSITNNYLGKHDLEDTEIIGNIFENADLLK